MKIALLADLHLPDSTGTLKEEILDWALAAARKHEVDRIVCAGDMVSGTRSAKRFRAKLEATGIPFLLTPGNAELRNSTERKQILEILTTPVEDEGLLLLDSSRGRFSDEARRLLALSAPPGVLGVTHCPPDCCTAEDRALLESAFESGRLAKLAAGHWHIDRSFETLELLRGLDPDKAVGGPPAFVIFDRHGRSEIAFEDADPRKWPKKARKEWCDYLGCSGMKDPLGVLERARGSGMKAFELRWSDSIDWKKLGPALDHWRGEGGRYLSLHMPEIGWDGEITGLTQFRSAAVAAPALGCNHVTIHVPHLTLGDFENGCDALLDELEPILTEFLDAGIEIGVENLHLTPTETPEERRFGYTPEECREWIELLRYRLDCCSRVGFHFDLGHARNNGVYASQYPISSWIAALGDEINGYHLHQVVQRPGEAMRNHMPLTELFGHLISLSSLFLAWERKRVNPAPMFLEIREGDPVESYLKLREALGV